MSSLGILRFAIVSLVVLVSLDEAGGASPAIPATKPAEPDQSGHAIPPPKLPADTLKLCRFLTVQASKQAAAITDSAASARAFQAVAAAQAEVGDFDPAVATLARLPGGVNANVGRTALCLSIDRSLYGLAGLAARVRNDALDSELANRCALAGRLVEAVSMLNRVKTPRQRQRLIRMILFEASSRGNNSVAEQMLDLIQADRPRNSSPGDIAEFAECQAICGKLDAARETLKAIKSDRDRAESMVGVVAAVSRRGDFATAKSLAAQIPYPAGDMAYLAIIEDLADTDQITDAQAIIPLLGDDDSKGEALYKIATCEAKSGKIDAAEAILTRIGHSDNQPIGLLRYDLVKALVKMGNLDKAHTLAEGIAGGARIDYGAVPKVQALCYIARAQAEKNDLAARQSIGEALAEARKVHGNDHATIEYNAYIIWALAPLNDTAQMAETCQAATNDPGLRCEIYTKAVDCLITVQVN